MATNDPGPAEKARCPQCGAVLPAGTPPENCPRCLLQAGLGAAAPGPQGTVRVPPPVPPQELLQAGQVFGHYRVVRPLGGGGMGAVFEAEDLETGRRIALKLLSHSLDSPDARQRFFREGRLAASINHPNSVYVFGTEEIVGTPVISMELVSGGTLQDRVNARGPMPWAEAVDATLQIIAGLEAAQRVGILHRDVKPSNCFVDPEGATKIGDFGLSISTAIRTEPSLTSSGLFLGTPSFCSPEQLRGEELSTRSDIYSVGATLFYLLTGRTPFEAKNMVALLATVLEHPAPSPLKFAPRMPTGLARVVRRCLEKSPGDRFRDYAELRQALAPYSSAAPVPAPLGIRFMAGVVDMLVLNLGITAAMMAIFGDPMRMLELLARGTVPGLMVVLGGGALAMSYYGIAEGLRGATPGKALCHLHVVAVDRNTPGLPRAFLRAFLYVVLPMAPFWFVYGTDIRTYLSSSGPVYYLMSFSYYGMLALLFSTARRRNGLAAVQDLLTGTRVIRRADLEQRPVIAPTENAAPQVEGTPRIGPYHILEQLPGGEWCVGYDLRLLRKVWIRTVPAGTPPVPAEWRNLGRPGRLRWLTGRREPQENWDAYEAPNGLSLVGLVVQPQPWGVVRFWVHDLATEIAVASRDQTLPALALDRVWITSEGRAKLLDFPVPGLVASGSAAEALEPVPFLDTVAAAALSGQASPAGSVSGLARPLPLHVRKLLDGLRQMADAASVAASLKPLLQRTTEVSRRRRAVVLLGCLAVPVPAIVGAYFGAMLLTHWQRQNPGLLELNTLLSARWAVQKFGGGEPVPDDRLFSIFIASQYRPTITNEAVWSNPIALALIKGRDRQFAEQSVAAYPDPTPEEITEATAALKRFVPAEAAPDFRKYPGMPFMVAYASAAFYVAIPAVLAALLFRGGLMLWVTGITFVRRDGKLASRGRLFWRALVAWSPMFVAVVLSLQPAAMKMPVRQLVISVLLLGLMGWSLAMRRSLPDRLAGTWPVLR